MKAVIIYRSKSGGTRMIAEAIGNACGIEVYDITKPHGLEDVDLLFVGTDVVDGQPDALMMEYLDDLPVKKIRAAAVFSTCKDGKDRVELVVSRLKHKGISMCREHYVCRSKRLFGARHPDDRDIEDAKAFGLRVLGAFEVEKGQS